MSTPGQPTTGSGMHVLVLGAGGQLGQAVVACLLRDSYCVRAFQRRSVAELTSPNLEVVLGDARHHGALAAAVMGQDAVVNAIGSGTLRRNTVESETTAIVLDVLRTSGPRRYIGISAGLVAPVSFLFDRLIRPVIFGNLYREHLAVEHLIRSCDLEWTIIRPTRLGNGQPRGYVEDARSRPDGRITMSRADVAMFISKEVRACRYVRQAVFLVSR